MSEQSVRLLLNCEERKQVAMRLIVFFIAAALVLGRLVYLSSACCIVFILYLSLLLYTVGDVLGQQCPSNGISRNFFNDISYPVPLNNPFCFRCCFESGDPCPSTVMWFLDGTQLTNGSINGSVLINSASILILPNPGNVLSVGNVLRCSALSQRYITITEFSKL